MHFLTFQIKYFFKIRAAVMLPFLYINVSNERTITKSVAEELNKKVGKTDPTNFIPVPSNG